MNKDYYYSRFLVVDYNDNIIIDKWLYSTNIEYILDNLTNYIGEEYIINNKLKEKRHNYYAIYDYFEISDGLSWSILKNAPIQMIKLILDSLTI